MFSGTRERQGGQKIAAAICSPLCNVCHFCSLVLTEFAHHPSEWFYDHAMMSLSIGSCHVSVTTYLRRLVYFWMADCSLKQSNTQCLWLFRYSVSVIAKIYGESLPHPLYKDFIRSREERWLVSQRKRVSLCWHRVDYKSCRQFLGRESFCWVLVRASFTRCVDTEGLPWW